MVGFSVGIDFVRAANSLNLVGEHLVQAERIDPHEILQHPAIAVQDEVDQSVPERLPLVRHDRIGCCRKVLPATLHEALPRKEGEDVPVSLPEERQDVVAGHVFLLQQPSQTGRLDQHDTLVSVNVKLCNDKGAFKILYLQYIYILDIDTTTSKQVAVFCRATNSFLGTMLPLFFHTVSSLNNVLANTGLTSSLSKSIRSSIDST